MRMMYEVCNVCGCESLTVTGECAWGDLCGAPSHSDYAALWAAWVRDPYGEGECDE